MRLKEYDFDPVDVDADGICASQTPAAGGSQNLSINGALASGGAWSSDVGGRQLVITAVGNESARTFTCTGTDPDGYALTEAVTGPNATAAETTEYFATITSIAVDDDTAGAVTVGTVDEIMSQTIPIDWRSDVVATVNVDVTGTIDVTVQQTFDDVQRPDQDPRSAYQNAQWLDITALADKTADTTASTTLGATAIRFTVNSYSSGAEAQMNLIHPNSRN